MRGACYIVSIFQDNRLKGGLEKMEQKYYKAVERSKRTGKIVNIYVFNTYQGLKDFFQYQERENMIYTCL